MNEMIKHIYIFIYCTVPSLFVQINIQTTLFVFQNYREILSVFHIRQKYVVQHGHKVDVRYLIFDWKVVKIDQLSRRPHQPIHLKRG